MVEYDYCYHISRFEYSACACCLIGDECNLVVICCSLGLINRSNELPVRCKYEQQFFELCNRV